MNYFIETKNPTQIHITVRAPSSELEPLVSKALQTISEETEIEGFRKGKAPRQIVKQKIGEFKLLEKAARMYIQENYEKILEEIENKEYKEKRIEPVGEPQVAITKLAPGQELEFTITLWLLPTLELPNYSAIAKHVLAGKKVSHITEKEVTDSIAWLRESRTKLITVSRRAKKGDRVEIDFSATQKGISLEDGRSHNHPLIIGQNRFIPGFEDELIGMHTGEEKTFILAVPAHYPNATLAGKSITFTAKMKLVQERQVPEWNDVLAQSLGNFPSAAAMEKNVREGLARENDDKERERLRMAMIEAIAEKTAAEIPDLLIEKEIEKMVAELSSSVEHMGIKFTDYLAQLKKNPDDLKREFRLPAVRRVKIALVLREIARQQALIPSAEDIQTARIKTIAKLGLGEEDVKQLDHRAFEDYTRGVARNEKVFQYLENL